MHLEPITEEDIAFMKQNWDKLSQGGRIIETDIYDDSFPEDW